jgi:acyl-CoA reductase-like NAD-dependent aldehyde dehydrogenase
VNTDEQAELISTVQAGLAAERMYGYIGEFVRRERKKVEEKVFKAIKRGDPLDPQVAIQAWIEIHAIEQVPAKLRREVKLGAAAAEKIEAAGIPLNP